MTQATLIHCEIDLDAPGKHSGYLRLPHSVHRSAYGFIPYPIVSIRNGDGPSVLLVSGNHGDEYEGQVALMDVIRNVRPEDINGQLIILPAANFPAVMAAMRTSPIDDGNLNREFPGNATGTPTQMIAHYISSVLAPRVDYSLDIHSGGTSLFYQPTLLTGQVPDPERRARMRKLIEAIGLPFTLVFRGGAVSGGRTLASAIRGAGGIPFACEMGGAAGLTPESVKTAKAMLRRYLAAVGIWSGPMEEIEPAAQTRYVAVGPDDYVYARESGIFEPAVSVGAAVSAGQIAGWVHFPNAPWRDVVEHRFINSGIVLMVRPISLCEVGDCLFQAGQPWPEAFA